MTFDISKDQDNSLSRKLKVNVTPEVILLDNEKVIYQGAIDNWYVELGVNRLKPNEHYLLDAIEAWLSKEDPRIKRTKAVGCPIAH